MSLKLTLKDGSQVESDSVGDLLEFYRQVSNGHPRPKTIAESRVTKSANSDLTEAAKKLIGLLLPALDGVDTGTVAKSFGVSPKGIGGTVTALTRWGQKNGLSKKQMLVKNRRTNVDGRSVRTLALTESFRKMIKEGKVPGVKLDN